MGSGSGSGLGSGLGEHRHQPEAELVEPGLSLLDLDHRRKGGVGGREAALAQARAVVHLREYGVGGDAAELETWLGLG